MKWGRPSDYLYVLRTTNSEAYTRRFMQWLMAENPELHRIMEAELEKLKKASRREGAVDAPGRWLRGWRP